MRDSEHESLKPKQIYMPLFSWQSEQTIPNDFTEKYKHFKQEWLQ